MCFVLQAMLMWYSLPNMCSKVSIELSIPVSDLRNVLSGPMHHLSYTFCTDDTLLRELLDKPGLQQCPVNVLDEAHERSLNTQYRTPF